MPTRSRLVTLALMTLEQGLARAEHGPVAPDAGYRLALAYLASEGLASDSDVKGFWTALLGRESMGRNSRDDIYVRTTTMGAILDRFHRAAGLEPPSLVQRGKWKEAEY